MIPYPLPSSFSASGIFLQVHFYMQTAASEFDQGHSTCTCVLEYELNLVLEYGRTELSGRHVCTLEYKPIV